MKARVQEIRKIIHSLIQKRILPLNLTTSAYGNLEINIKNSKAYKYCIKKYDNERKRKENSYHRFTLLMVK